MNCRTLLQRSARSCATNIFWDTARVINHMTRAGGKSRSSYAPPRDFRLSACSRKQATTRLVFSRLLLALSNDVTTLWTQSASKAEIEAVGRSLLDATLRALVRKASLKLSLSIDAS